MNYAGPLAAAQFRMGAALRFNVRSAWDNAAIGLRMCWPWLVVLTGLDLLARLPAGYPLSLLLLPARGVDPVLAGLVLAVKLIAVSSLAVSWSRFLLLGEIATGWDRMRVDRPVWRFACNVLLIWFACSGIILLGGLVTFIAIPVAASFAGYALPDVPHALPQTSGWLQNPWMLVVAASLLIGILGGLPVVHRLSIKLTAIAMGREEYGLGDAWRDSGGQPLRLVAFSFAVVLLVAATWAAAFLVSWQFGDATAASLVGSAAAAVATGLTVILATASIAVLFGIFVEGREV